MELYDLETPDEPKGGFTSKVVCPNHSTEEFAGMTLLKVLRDPNFIRAKIAIYQCRICLKRWLGIGS